MPRKKRKQRVRSPHPGVVVLARRAKRTDRDRPGAVLGYRARWRDPDTGAPMFEKLDPVALSTEEARRGWAIKKAKGLAARRMELAAGALPLARTPLGEAIDGFLDSAAHRLRTSTLESYKRSLGFFREWAGKDGVASVDGLTGPVLARFREALIAQRRVRSAAGEVRGAKKATETHRAPATVNHVLREVGAALSALRLLGQAPRLSRDAIADALKSLPLERSQPRPLTPQQCRSLLRAAQAHDAATFKLTRKEHARDALATEANRTPRYEPIAPYVLFVLLTGCRAGEAMGVTWEDVDLEAPDESGAVVGEVRLQATAVKTRTERRIDLSVCPSVRALLAAMRVRAGSDRFVFGGKAPLPRHDAENARRRLLEDFGAPVFSWQQLRVTAACYLTNAPSIFGAASIYRSAAQLGHSPDVASRHYLGVLRGLSRGARTLEAVMGIENEAGSIAASQTARRVAAAG